MFLAATLIIIAYDFSSENFIAIGESEKHDLAEYLIETFKKNKNDLIERLNKLEGETQELKNILSTIEKLETHKV